MDTYLFSLGVVPVQEWIAEARRSRDLKAGSVLLSFVMARLLAEVEGWPEADVVLPRPPGGRPFAELARRDFAAALADPYGIPNRASGYFEAAGPEQAAGLLGDLERRLLPKVWGDWMGSRLEAGSTTLRPPPEEQDFWGRLAEHLRAYHDRLGPGGSCPLSLVWVAERVELGPAEDETTRLHRHLGRIDELFTSVKRTRPVRVWVGDTVGKCNQCGRREALGPAGDFAAWSDWQRGLEALPWVRREVRINAGERLCPVCLAKRMAGYADARAERGSRNPFPSTGRVAAGPWIALARTVPEVAGVLDEIEEQLPTGEDLGAALYRRRGVARRSAAADDGTPFDRIDRELIPRLDQAIERRNDSLRPASSPPAAAAAAPGLARSTVPPGSAESPPGASEPRPAGERAAPLPRRPNPYLALLAFDGDSMGERMREAPRELSARLDVFAGRAREVVETGGGAVFYLGGDEGLAMAPAMAVLALAAEIRASFDTAVAGVAGVTVTPTLSVGVALFEQSSPIAGAIRAAQEALKHAKAIDPGKDALAVAVETASGTRWKVRAHWGTAWDRLARAAEAVRAGEIAAGWPHDVERFLRTLEGESWHRLAADPAPVRDEVRRLLLRRLPALPPPAHRRHRLDDLWRRLEGERWWEPGAGGEPPGSPEPDHLHLVAFLARQGEGAVGEEARP